MDNSERIKRYKKYLEPESDEPIPSTSFYRYRKQLVEQNAAGSHSQKEYVQHCVKEVDTSVHSQDVYNTPSNSENAPVVRARDVHSPGIDGKEPIVDLQVSHTEIPSQENDQYSEVIWPLAEEIDRIENETPRVTEEEHYEDVPDFILASIYDDATGLNDATTEDDTGEHLLQDYTSLEDAIEKEVFKKLIKMPVDKTVGEVVLITLKFILVHALSLSAATDLFCLINSIFTEPFLCQTRFLIDKLFYPKNCTILYATCSKCGAGIGRFEKNDRYLQCKICKTDINVKDYAFKDFFVMMDVRSPISKLIESNDEYYFHTVNRRIHENGYLRDIYDGKRYREFVNKLDTAHNHQYATLTFNTDGAPLFESSSYSIWPIFLMVNEVPYDVRSKELILAGLWFGKNKPDMTVFLDPFVDRMNELSIKGVECIVRGINMFVKIFVLICCVDAVARAPVQGFTQFNGSYGCGQCLHPGEWVRSNSNNPRSGNIKYTLQNAIPKKRSFKETVEHIKLYLESNVPVFGVKNVSPLINLLHYDIIESCVVDSLHCCSGIAKQFATLWFGNKSKAGLLSKGIIKKIDELLNNFKAPHQVVRLTRSFSDKEFWKAREWENWSMFYSMVILKDILPTNLLMHWALFVEAFYILTKGEVTTVEVDLADKLLHKFVGQTELLYGKVSMTFNVHSLLHLATSVYNWGPLWAHNAYAFESGNGDLLKVIHAAKGVHHQICRQISMKYSFVTLRDEVIPYSSFTIKNYCNTIGKRMTKQTFQVNAIRYFGAISKVDAIWLGRLNLSESSVSYTKMVKTGCLYMTSLKGNNRSDNSYALLKNNSYVKINRFLVDASTRKEYTIVTKIQTTHAYNNACTMLQQMVEIDNEESAILSNDIDRVCVHMTLDANEYLCAVPNLQYY